eukprot:CAMPEP_0195538896 /NCGR_PEP_ID=MMETSP0794_2-20130614/49770_1 /TAXON_ID=515487 /ORGANISM="Stephanopyxis turris, Strain CCMP 815" /LENGTH=660 /DNA_ID=CAMNT_0040672907 /DNA_START=479 /DNA_END=2463 /DNA_ORIENTATION=+
MMEEKVQQEPSDDTPEGMSDVRNRVDYSGLSKRVMNLTMIVAKERQMRRLSATHFESTNFLLFFLNILLTFVSGVISLIAQYDGSNVGNDESIMNFTLVWVGIVSLLSTFLQSLSKHLNWDSKADNHRTAAIALSKVFGKLKTFKRTLRYEMQKRQGGDHQETAHVLNRVDYHGLSKRVINLTMIVAKERQMRRLAASHFKSKNFVLFVSNVLLTFFSGAIALIAQYKDSKRGNDESNGSFTLIWAGVASLLSTFLQSLSKQLNWDSKVDNHRTASIALSKVFGKLTTFKRTLRYEMQKRQGGDHQETEVNNQRETGKKGIKEKDLFSELVVLEEAFNSVFENSTFSVPTKIQHAFDYLTTELDTMLLCSNPLTDLGDFCEEIQDVEIRRDKVYPKAYDELFSVMTRRPGLCSSLCMDGVSKLGVNQRASCWIFRCCSETNHGDLLLDENHSGFYWNFWPLLLPSTPPTVSRAIFSLENTYRRGLLSAYYYNFNTVIGMNDDEHEQEKELLLQTPLLASCWNLVREDSLQNAVSVSISNETRSKVIDILQDEVNNMTFTISFSVSISNETRSKVISILQDEVNNMTLYNLVRETEEQRRINEMRKVKARLRYKEMSKNFIEDTKEKYWAVDIKRTGEDIGLSEQVDTPCDNNVYGSAKTP